MEIGIRMALGAQQLGVLTMVLRETFVLVIAGIVIGLPLAFTSTRAASSVLSDLLFGIKPTDPLSFGITIVTLLSVAVLAGYIPARRAANIDPMTALRRE